MIGLTLLSLTPSLSQTNSKSHHQPSGFHTTVKSDVVSRGEQEKRSMRCHAAWVENSAKKEISAPVESCYPLWLDRELVPAWMPWISSVTVLKEEPELSCWLLKTKQFDRDWEFTWIARSLEPIPNRKVHWKSESPPDFFNSPGTAVDLNNRGQVRFFPATDSTCVVTLSIEYQVPEILVPFAQLLTPLVESILTDNLTRFDKYAISAYKQQQKLKS